MNARAKCLRDKPADALPAETQPGHQARPSREPATLERTCPRPPTRTKRQRKEAVQGSLSPRSVGLDPLTSKRLRIGHSCDVGGNAFGRWSSSMALAMICTVAPRSSDAADGPRESGWLTDLQGDVRADVAAGRPIVVEVHVPLCDNAFITCGGRGRGDGDDLQRNLYWATSEGLVGWMNRRGSGWSQVSKVSKVDGAATGDPDLLERRVWRREVAVPRAWGGAGMPARFPVYLVGNAWRGRAVDRA